MKIIKYIFFLVILVLLQSCGSRKLPEESVKIYEGQLNLMDGYYLINSYDSPSMSQSLKGIDSFFDIKIPLSITFVNLKFIDDETLQLSYESEGFAFKKTFPGELKNGAFYLSSNRYFIGIPLTVFTKENNFERVIMGSDDNLILERFEEKVSRIFNAVEETYFWESYTYDRLYKNIHIDKEGNLIE
ncbi:hypothetical protein [Psychroflexus lacisalsi]|jgi:hypothetical protein|nr:hypothetical protein [Psychroflexus lacisalsi]MBZ9619989.1 hypothetical protein [Psychroflexus lacisalsi]